MDDMRSYRPAAHLISLGGRLVLAAVRAYIRAMTLPHRLLDVAC